MDLIRLTVIIGIYNCASTLDEALDSLYAQTYKDYRIVLCDDGSTDNTYSIAKRHAENHSNIILIRNETNKGLNYTLNRCLQFVETEYVARMDGDDISLPTRFEKEIKVLDDHPEYAIVSSPMLYFDEEGVFKTGTAKMNPQKKDFVKGTPFCHAASMCRTAAIMEVDGYSIDDRLLRVEDYHLWMKLYAVGFKGYNIQEPLYMMRDDRNAQKRRNWQNRKNEIYVRHIGFKMLGLPWYSQLFALRPLLVFLTPTCIYRWFHKH